MIFDIQGKQALDEELQALLEDRNSSTQKM
jgi:hypothetical protein